MAIPKDLYIWVVSPKGYSHVRAFDEVVFSLKRGFENLGFSIVVHWGELPLVGIPLIVGANLLRAVPEGSLPNGSIIYNLEQIDEGSDWLSADYIEVLRKHLVWDYSQANIAALAALGVTNAVHVPIGYVAELERIVPAEPDIDVLFVGSLNKRRSDILESIAARGLNVVSCFDVYGAERDALYARTKVFLNVHALEAKVFEVVRVSYALANGLFVISERGLDTELDGLFDGGVCWASVEQIGDLCVEYCQSESARNRVADRGREIVRSMPIEEILSNAFSIQIPDRVYGARRASSALNRALSASDVLSAPEIPDEIVRIFGNRRHPYYIVAPQWATNSSGIQVLYRLCRSLLTVGEEAWIVNIGWAQHSGPFVGADVAVPLLSETIAKLHLQSGLNPIVVYPEIVSGNPLGANVVARWVLYYPGVNGGEVSYADTEMIYGYHTDFIRNLGRGKDLWVPTPDPREWMADSRQDRDPELRLVYAHKYRRSGASPRTHGGLVTELRLDWPDRKALKQLFARAAVLFLYDASALGIEAALAGCPVVYMPEGFGDGELLTKLLCSSIGVLWNGDDESSIMQARALREREPWPLESLGYLSGKFWKDLEAFIADTQTRAQSSSAPSALRVDLLRQEPATELLVRHALHERDQAVEENKRLNNVLKEMMRQAELLADAVQRHKKS